MAKANKNTKSKRIKKIIKKNIYNAKQYRKQMIKKNKIRSDYNSLYNKILKISKKTRTKSYFRLTMEVFNIIFRSLCDPRTG
jgi:hypothetical protein